MPTQTNITIDDLANPNGSRGDKYNFAAVLESGRAWLYTLDEIGSGDPRTARGVLQSAAANFALKRGLKATVRKDESAGGFLVLFYSKDQAAVP